MNTNSEEIEKLIRSLGGSIVGFSNVHDKLPEQLRKYPYAITVGIRLSDAIIDEIEDKPTFTYFHHYRTVNSLIDQITLRCSLLIGELGYKSIPVPASQTVNEKDGKYQGIFPHKTAAVLAGLGWVGKNGLFISCDYGPRVRMGTVLTNMELPCTGEIMNEKCGKCNLCVKDCPATALSGMAWRDGIQREDMVDAAACSEYMKKKFQHIGRGSVCGICIKVCPKGKR